MYYIYFNVLITLNWIFVLLFILKSYIFIHAYSSYVALVNKNVNFDAVFICIIVITYCKRLNELKFTEIFKNRVLYLRKWEIFKNYDTSEVNT